MNPAFYFKDYRSKLGFPNQTKAREFLAAKDLLPGIDYEYIDSLNDRLGEIITKLNSAIHPSVRRKNITGFIGKAIVKPYQTIKAANLIPRLNNQGRRPEDVLFSWLRGFAAVDYFTPAISSLLAVQFSSILTIGDDDLCNVETFRRTPKADLEISKGNKSFRVEVQSGFQGVNDIKEHKVREAKRLFREQGQETICIHFDIYNGQAAFVNLALIEDSDVNWVTRQQLEGQSVFAIEQNFFKWRFLDPIPDLAALDINLS